jgi:hypothetical protein
VWLLLENSRELLQGDPNSQGIVIIWSWLTENRSAKLAATFRELGHRWARAVVVGSRRNLMSVPQLIAYQQVAPICHLGRAACI